MDDEQDKPPTTGPEQVELPSGELPAIADKVGAFVQGAAEIDLKRRKESKLGQHVWRSNKYVYDDKLQNIQLTIPIPPGQGVPGVKGYQASVPFWDVPEHLRNGAKLYERPDPEDLEDVAGFAEGVAGAVWPVKATRSALEFYGALDEGATQETERALSNNQGAQVLGEVAGSVFLGMAAPGKFYEMAATRWPAYFSKTAPAFTKIAPTVGRMMVEGGLLELTRSGINAADAGVLTLDSIAASLTPEDVGESTALGAAFGGGAGLLIKGLGSSAARSLAKRSLDSIESIKSTLLGGAEKLEGATARAASAANEAAKHGGAAAKASGQAAEAGGKIRGEYDKTRRALISLHGKEPQVASEAFSQSSLIVPADAPTGVRDFSPWHVDGGDIAPGLKGQLEPIARLTEEGEAAVGAFKSDLADISELADEVVALNPDHPLAPEVRRLKAETDRIFGTKAIIGDEGKVYTFHPDVTIQSQFIRHSEPEKAVHALRDKIGEIVGPDKLDQIFLDIGDGRAIDPLSLDHSIKGMRDFGRSAESAVWSDVLDEGLYSAPGKSSIPGKGAAKIRAHKASGDTGDVYRDAPGTSLETAQLAGVRSEEAKAVLSQMSASQAKKAEWARRNAPKIAELEAKSEAILNKYEQVVSGLRAKSTEASNLAGEAMAQHSMSAGDAMSAASEARFAALATEDFAREIHGLNYGALEPTAKQMATPAYQRLATSMGDDVARARVILDNATHLADETPLSAIAALAEKSAAGRTFYRVASRAMNRGGVVRAVAGIVSAASGLADGFLGALYPAAKGAPANTAAVALSALRRGKEDPEKARRKREVDELKTGDDYRQAAGFLTGKTRELAEKTIERDMMVSSHLGGVAQRQQAFLASKSVPMQPWANPNAQSLSFAKRRQMRLYLDGARNPMALVHEMKAGRINPETAEAIKSVWPGAFGWMQGNLMQALSRPGNSPATMKRLRSFASAFGMNSGVDVAANQALFTDPETGAPAAPRMADKATIGSPSLTPAQELGVTSSVPHFR